MEALISKYNGGLRREEATMYRMRWSEIECGHLLSLPVEALRRQEAAVTDAVPETEFFHGKVLL